MKTKISFLVLVCLTFVFLLALPGLAGTWRADFEDGKVLDRWGPLDAPAAAVEKGKFSMNIAGLGPGLIFVYWPNIPGMEAWQDYTIKCKMKFVATGDFAGISFRDTGMMWERYGFVINPASNTASAWKAFQGAITFPSEIPLPFTVSKDTWYELKIIVEGEHFEFYIDGEPAGEFEDDDIPSGMVGLCVRNAHAHFDDLIISGDDVEDGGSWKAVEPKGKQATTWGRIKCEHGS